MLLRLALWAWTLYQVGAVASQHEDVVHVVFSNHLDIGFDGINPEIGFDNVVINKYFDWYFPLAARLGAWFDKNGQGTQGHIYTAHAYIVSLFLDCPPGMGLNCPDDQARAHFLEAARNGHITWTALPFNGQVEMMDEQSLISATHVTFYVDDHVGVPHKTVISQRDVPGMTRAALPVLTEQGVRALSVGVNSGSAPPGVPLNEAFVWRDEESNTDVLAFWHPYGYGGHIGEGPSRVQLTPAEDCVKTPRDSDGRRDILCFSWRGDNSGPHTDPDEVLKVFEAASQQFPNATISASTFEDFVNRLEIFKDNLPVVTEEIGDTWIYGVASDPVKLQRYRALQRMRSQCLYSESCTAQDPKFRNFTRLLLKIPEHTWGVDSKRAPASWDIWANEDFRAALDENELFPMAQQSWARQLAYVQWSVEALTQSPQHASFQALLHSGMQTLEAPPQPSEEALAALTRPGHLRSPHCRAARAQTGASLASVTSSHASELHPKSSRKLAADSAIPRVRIAADADAGIMPSTTCASEPVVLDTDYWHVKIDSDTGKILSLYRKWIDSEGNVVKGSDWAANGTFGDIVYQTYSEDYFTEWDLRYNPQNIVWEADFAKPGSSKGGAKDRSTRPTFAGLSSDTGPAEGEQVLHLHYNFTGWPVEEAGAPHHVMLVIRTWTGSNSVMMDVVYHDKRPTRLPEALWVRFRPDPAVMDTDKMQIAKVDTFISPHHTIVNGSFSSHVTMDGGVVVPTLSDATPWESLQVAAMDAGLLNLGHLSALPDFRGPARPDEGFSWCLFNNAWGTNYVMWTPYMVGDIAVGASMKFRFVVTVRDSRTGIPPRAMLSRDLHFSDHAEVQAMYR